jgi:mono/diheme cytochrome c family protein
MHASALHRLSAAAALVAGLLAAPAVAQDSMGSPEAEELRLTRPGQPDLVLPPFNPVRGRVYFATRACVVCHQVNGIGGRLAPVLEFDEKDIDVFDFVTRMWRGAREMLALQDSLFGEPIDLAPDELADIIAFVYDANERKKFSENDIPQFIREFMAARSRVPKPAP